MGKYSYDESGDFFNYFVLSILALVLIPTTWSSLFPESTALVGKEGRTKVTGTGLEGEGDKC